MRRHDPGPWEIDGDGIVGKDDVFIAKVTARRTKKEARANLRLIASAPQLLDGLRAIVGKDWLERGAAGLTATLEALADLTGSTPGPWRVHPDIVIAGYRIAGKEVGPEGSAPVCVAIGWTREEKENETEEANAHLIAACPEMIDALRYAGHRRANGTGWNLEEARRLARAAIRRARGKDEVTT